MQGVGCRVTDYSKARPHYIVIRSNQPDPVVMVTAGIHGTEVAGIEVAKGLRNLRLRKGTLVIVPLVNRGAYRRRTRGIPDVNRLFPRKSGDRVSHPLASGVWKLAKRYRPHWCIDLHEANGYARFDRSKLGQTVILYPHPSTHSVVKKALRRVNPTVRPEWKRFLVRRGVLLGSFRTSAGRLLGCRALTVETSMQQRRSTRIRYQTALVHALLKEIGVL